MGHVLAVACRLCGALANGAGIGAKGRRFAVLFDSVSVENKNRAAPIFRQIIEIFAPAKRAARILARVLWKRSTAAAIGASCGIVGHKSGAFADFGNKSVFFSYFSVVCFIGSVDAAGNAKTKRYPSGNGNKCNGARKKERPHIKNPL